MVLAMIVLSTVGISADGSPAGFGIGGTLAIGLALLALLALFVRYGAERLLRYITRMPELLVTFALAWTVIFAAVCDFIGLGKELGGLIAGVSLASTSFREALASRLASLRDFLLLFFFIGLGSGLRIGLLGDQVIPALVLSAFVLVGNPLIMGATAVPFGFPRLGSWPAAWSGPAE
ncbi:cation:proton antiporter domain-containing protein [Microvirga roseola]|uniref:cation:proton antiporter domain-containing protein n=1 Tax=Microvirga roseola TaxID=2883126 RepID=UPI001E58A959|nr:cation:proton antiporter [Microvirga roseola]